MGSFSIWHWLIVLVIVLLLFGRDKIPKLMGDMAKGVREFKKGLKDEDKADAAADPAERKTIEGEAVRPNAAATEKDTATKS